MKTFDIVVRGRLIQNDAVINSRLIKCDVVVSRVPVQFIQEYISISSGIAFLAQPVSMAAMSYIVPDMQENGVAVGCLCDAVIRRLRKLSEADALGALSNLDEMALSEIDYLEQ